MVKNCFNTLHRASAYFSLPEPYVGVYLHHGGHRVDPVHVFHQALCDVGYAQADGPVGVTLQSDHLVRTETQHRNTDVMCGVRYQTNKQQ